MAELAQLVEKTIKTVEGFYKSFNCDVGMRTEPWLVGIRCLCNFETGGAICSSDVELFATISKIMQPKSIFCVGNAFGYSTLIISQLFPQAHLDVIDAETEGKDNRFGSRITREIAKKHKLDINLYSGFSPQDTPKALQRQKYELAFIDGLHSNEQLLKDFRGIHPYLSDECVVVCHDVALCHLQPAIFDCLSFDSQFEFIPYVSTNYSNTIGTSILTRKIKFA